MYMIYIYKTEVVFMKFQPVSCPDRTVIVKQKNHRYVYLTKAVTYRPDLKCSRPDRVCIGKLDEEGMLIPNQNYIDIFGESVMVQENAERCDSICVGPHFVMDHLARTLHLDEILRSVFPGTAVKILDIATYMIMTEDNVMQYFDDYGYDHSLFNGDKFTDSTISRILSDLKPRDIDRFIEAWVHMHASREIYVAYDSTNMNTRSAGIELAEHGHAKDDPDLPQVNVSLGYDQTDLLPLFYELYPGSIIDNTGCEKMVERAKRYGMGKIGFILDRGYFSLRNIRFLEEGRYDYLLMVKGNARWIREAVDMLRTSLKAGMTGYMPEHEIYGGTLRQELKGMKGEKYVHVYYDGVRAEQEKIEINRRYGRMEQVLEELKEKKIKRKEDVAQYERYYRLKFDDNGYFLSYRRREDKVLEMMEQAGIFVLVTSERMSASEALETYRDRDAIEKIFRMEKSYLGNDVFRVHSDEHMESKMFISFIALILRNEIYRRMKELYRKNRKEYTVPKVLRELSKMKMTKLSDDRYHQRYALTNKQKKILEAMGTNEKAYREFLERARRPLEE